MPRILKTLLRSNPLESVKGVWFQEEARAERLANLVRMIYMIAWLVGVIPAARIHPPSANIGNIGGGLLWLILAVLYHTYLLNRPYKPAFKYLSTTVDVLMTVGILFAYHFDMGYSATLKAPPFMNFLLAIALAAFRFSISLPLFAGALTIVSYSIMFGVLVKTQNIDFGSPVELFTTPKINLVYQFYGLLYVVTGTILVSVLVGNIQRLVRLRVKEAENVLTEKAEREKTVSLFERYFSSEIAGYMARHHQEMGGRSQRVTILITDLRGFTTVSEKLGPARSVSMLNQVFENLVDVVFQHGGTLDKFGGDGMMVVFGVPDPRPDDALRAVFAARQMIANVRDLNTEIPLQLGIAIHTGEVIFGNVGSPKRMELTVIGDPVNTTFRIEALNKEFGTSIIISEATYAEVSDAVPVHELPPRKLRGKSEAIRLFAVE